MSYTAHTLRAEIREQCQVGMPTESEQRRFVAEFFPLDCGWEGIANAVDEDRALQRDIEKLIKDAIAGASNGAGRYAAMQAIGKIIVELAEERVRPEVDEMIDEFLNGQPDYGYDVPEVERVALDRSAA